MSSLSATTAHLPHLVLGTSSGAVVLLNLRTTVPRERDLESSSLDFADSKFDAVILDAFSIFSSFFSPSSFLSPSSLSSSSSPSPPLPSSAPPLPPPSSFPSSFPSSPLSPYSLPPVPPTPSPPPQPFQCRHVTNSSLSDIFQDVQSVRQCTTSTSQPSSRSLSSAVQVAISTDGRHVACVLRVQLPCRTRISKEADASIGGEGGGGGEEGEGEEEEEEEEDGGVEDEEDGGNEAEGEDDGDDEEEEVEGETEKERVKEGEQVEEGTTKDGSEKKETKGSERKRKERKRHEPLEHANADHDDDDGVYSDQSSEGKGAFSFDNLILTCNGNSLHNKRPDLCNGGGDVTTADTFKRVIEENEQGDHYKASSLPYACSTEVRSTLKEVQRILNAFKDLVD